MSGQSIACVVPALDAAPSLAAVVCGLRDALPHAAVVVVDDGSSDGTGKIAQHVADEAVRFARNRGKGAALRAGFAVALARGCDTVVTVDADGQHDPRCAPALVDALAHAELAIGARDRRTGEMPLGRRITNGLSAVAVARCIGQPVADAQSGFRALRASLAADITPRSDRYEFETEFLIMTARRGYRVAFVPIPTRYPSIVPSRFRPVRDSARIVTALWRAWRGASC